MIDIEEVKRRLDLAKDNWFSTAFAKLPTSQEQSMTPDVLGQIIDEVFAALEAATAKNFLLHAFVVILHSLAKSLVPQILPILKSKAIVP